MHKDFLSNAGLPDCELEARIVRELERKPDILVDARFTARVMARAAQIAIAPAKEPVISRRVGFAAAFILLVAMSILAPAASLHSATTLVLQYGLCAEFLALAVWLGLSPRSR